MRQRYYDWQRWFARGSFVLLHGRDWVCSPAAVLQQLRNRASAAGLRVRTRMSADWREIRVQVLPKAKAGRERAEAV